MRSHEFLRAGGVKDGSKGFPGLLAGKDDCETVSVDMASFPVVILNV